MQDVLKQRNLQIALVAAMALMMPGCDIVGDIFQAGFVIGIILIIVIIAVIAWIFKKVRGR